MQYRTPVCSQPHTAPLLAIANGAAEHQLLVGSECGALFLLDARRLDDLLDFAASHRFNALRVPLSAADAAYVASIMRLPTSAQVRDMAPDLPSLTAPELMLFVLAFSNILDRLHQTMLRARYGLAFEVASDTNKILSVQMFTET